MLPKLIKRLSVSLPLSLFLSPPVSLTYATEVVNELTVDRDYYSRQTEGTITFLPRNPDS